MKRLILLTIISMLPLAGCQSTPPTKPDTQYPNGWSPLFDKKVGER